MAAWYSNRHATLIVVLILVLREFSGFHADAMNDVPGKETGSFEMRFRKVTVYDVSALIRDHNSSNSTEILLPETSTDREINTSEFYNFKLNDSPYYRFCEPQFVGNSGVVYRSVDCPQSMIKGISIIFRNEAKREDMLSMRNLALTKTTLRELLGMKNPLIDSVTISLAWMPICQIMGCIPEYLINDVKIDKLKRFVKFGIEYDNSFLEECGKHHFPLVQYLDHTVLRIKVSPRSSMHSYGTFKNLVQSALTKSTVFAQPYNRKCTLYVRIEIENPNEISNEYFEKYDALIVKFWYALSKQPTGTEIYILSAIPKRAYIQESNEFFRERVTQKFDGFLTECACVRQQAMKAMLSNSRSIRVEIMSSKISFLDLLFATCDHASNQIAQSNITISLFMYETEPSINGVVERMTQMIGNNSVRINIERLYINSLFLSRSNRLDLYANASHLANLLQTNGIDTGCIANIDVHDNSKKENASEIIDIIVRDCGDALLNVSKEIVIFFRHYGRQDKELFDSLHSFHNAKETFERMYPGKVLTPEFFHSTYESTFYCDPVAKHNNKQHQAVLSFANIHGWPKVIIGSNYCHAGTNNEIDRSATAYNVLFRTNTPPSVDQELPLTYPCIQKTLNVYATQSQINFLESEYSGATFPMNIRQTSPLSTAELQMSLELVLTEFPFVELTAASREDLKAVESMIVANARNSRQLSNISMPLIYTEVPLVDAQGIQEEILSFLANNKHSGVHFSGWESAPIRLWDFWKGFEYRSSLNFGLSVQNCSHEMNSRLATLKNMPLLSQVSYVICNVTPVVPFNFNVEWMNTYFGTLLYTKSYMEHFLSPENVSGKKIEVMFRLNLICSKQLDGMENFLTFINDVNQHSAAYKIRYFIVRAFEKEMSSTTSCSNSWWRLDSYADLTNRSTYVNREDEFAGRQAQIPYEPSQTPVEKSNPVYIIVFASIVTLLLLAILCLCVYHKRTKTKLLTALEVRHFYNGGEQSNLTNTSDYLDFGNMKFPKHYEIPRKDIETEEVIGSGQFGMVFRGILSKRIEVAIKVPRTDCGKSQFISTLSELKILCHIGQHLNIVSFLGACTKDIANGNLHIVIEYCSNGCLLKYLRENRESGTISLFELYGFSHQIASGMEYVAEKRVIHGDLAARNVLLTSEWTCKIADFGLSRRLYEMDEYKKTSQEPLPWRWMAPESLRDMEFTTKSDVWSYGVTLWEIYSLGMVPYPGLNWTVNYVSELDNGMRMEKAPHATDNIHAKTLECWNAKSDARPTFTQLKEFFVGLRNQEYMKLELV